MTQITQQQVMASDGTSADLGAQLASMAQSVSTNASAITTNAAAIAANGTKISNIPLKGAVSATSNLPASGNTSGDLYFVIGAKQFYTWDTTSTPQWLPAGGGEQIGTAFPTAGLYSGLMFYRTDLEALFVYNATAQAWVQK